MNTDLKHAMFSFKKLFDENLDVYLESKKVELKEIDLSLYNLVDHMQSQILRSGKRIRPFLAYQAYILSGGENEDLIMELCMGIELLHQYLLIHDDIIDRDETRYGSDSLHKVYAKNKNDDHFGNSMAMISGDLLISLVNQIFLNLSTPDDLRHELQAMLQKTIINTTAGWQIHFLQNKRPISNVEESEYIKGMEMVSGYYTFVSPLAMGSVISGNPQYLSELTEYGSHAGLAFQIGDDLLGIFGDSKKTGKPAGNDFREGKKTLLVLRSHKNGTNEQRMFIENNLGTNITQKQLAELRDIMIQTNSLEYSQNLSSTHIESAKQSLTTLPDTTIIPDILSSLADFLKDREK